MLVGRPQTGTAAVKWLTSPDLGGGHTATRLMDSLCRRWAACKLANRSAWPGHQFSATVRINPLQHLLRTGRTKGAFKRANPGICGLRGQVFVAAFAPRSQFKHCQLSKVETLACADSNATNSGQCNLGRSFLRANQNARTITTDASSACC